MNLPAGVREAVGWPLFGGIEDGRLPLATGEQALRESIVGILLTSPGERLMRPHFGAGLRRFVHEPNHETTRGLIAAAARTALTRHEPRIILLAVRVEADPRRPTWVAVHVEYRARHDAMLGTVAVDLEVGR